MAGGGALGWVGTASDFLRQGALVKLWETPVTLEVGLHVVVRRRRDERITRFLDWITRHVAEEDESLHAPLRPR